MSGLHSSHRTRPSDASTFDDYCINCGAKDESPGGWGLLAFPCPKQSPEFNVDFSSQNVIEQPLDAIIPIIFDTKEIRAIWADYFSKRRNYEAIMDAAQEASALVDVVHTNLIKIGQIKVN